MARPRKRTLPRTGDKAPPPEPPRPVAAVDMGASAIRLVVAEAPPGEPLRILEEASRGVLLGKDTFTRGRFEAATIEATLKAMAGFRRIMDTYGVVRYRAVATSAVREAQNRETFLDRVRLRTGIDVEIIDGSEENRLTYLAVREALRGHPALEGADGLMVALGGGSADLSYLRKGEPIHSGTYALGSIRMQQNLLSWSGSLEQQNRLLRRHVHNVVSDIRREMPLREARHFIALGADARFAASRALGEQAPDDPGPRVVPAPAFVAVCDELATLDSEQLVRRYHLPQADAETLVPALLAYRELLLETQAETVTVPEASLRLGLLLDLTRGEDGVDFEALRRQVLASALVLGERYHADPAHAKNVAYLATRLFDELKPEHGLGDRERLLLEVSALLHDVGIHVSLRGHHKHSQYLLSVSEIFGLTRDDLAVVSNVARYHRRGTPQKSHLPYMSLDSDTRVVVNKLAAILRFTNALDADHLQKIRDLKVADEQGAMAVVLDGGGDLTMERLAAQSRADMMADVFGRRVVLREGART
ncbi:MAG: HD domain-containing protein [Vicinamibacteria bacterium]